MGFIDKTEAGKWKAFWREPSGVQRSKTFGTEREAKSFLAQVEVAKSTGTYVSPHAGRTRFGEHAQAWMKTWNHERTTTGRDESIMRTHVLAQWSDWQLGKVDHLSVQQWITELSSRRSPATVAECKRLMSGVMRSAVRNRLIGVDPTEGVKVPRRRKTDKDEARILTRDEVRQQLLPAIVPQRHRAMVALTAFAGLRWGEVAGLCEDAVDLDRGLVRVIRTVTEVGGHTEFKPFPKSAAGRRTIPLPAWVVTELRGFMAEHPRGDRGLIFANEAGAPLRRGLFRARIWRPALVRAGLLGEVCEVGDGYEAVWMDEDGSVASEVFGKYEQAVKHVAANEAGGLRFHDLRDCYGTWLADEGVEPHKIAKVMGHEKMTTTMAFYIRRQDDYDAVRGALGDDEDGDDGTASIGAVVG
ncbi:tyrosine-type recombinase/integrase [Nocardia brasiliensis]|uniref:Tyrosine-type recombinase/integrase n=1 Tax=Nocardia brasiliensis TaxID=37326 RepID=A0A6G9XJ51_NOCBR|nr:site-specific integrase [Nocardia brasiliensis]QIS00942.1 tyrosine-type recombinase/integrase [Nocardia brasiliensis]